MPTEISGSTGVNKIQDNTIVNADINSSAAIAGSKISGGTGKVLQVVSGTSTGSTSTSSQSYVASNLAATITPTSTSSKIYINVTAFVQQAAQQNHCTITIYRDSTDLAAGQSKGFGNWYSSTGGFTELFASASHLDSPSSTSAITYKIYIKTENSNSAMTIGSTARRQTITLMEIAG